MLSLPGCACLHPDNTASAQAKPPAHSFRGKLKSKWHFRGQRLSGMPLRQLPWKSGVWLVVNNSIKAGTAVITLCRLEAPRCRPIVIPANDFDEFWNGRRGCGSKNFKTMKCSRLVVYAVGRVAWCCDPFDEKGKRIVLHVLHRLGGINIGNTLTSIITKRMVRPITQRLTVISGVPSPTNRPYPGSSGELPVR